VKKILALVYVLILVCSIAAVTLATCGHLGQQVVYSATNKSWEKPHWTNCVNNGSMHPHIRFYRQKVYGIYCPTCNQFYEKYVTEYLGETCPCAK